MEEDFPNKPAHPPEENTKKTALTEAAGPDASGDLFELLRLARGKNLKAPAFFSTPTAHETHLWRVIAVLSVVVLGLWWYSGHRDGPDLSPPVKEAHEFQKETPAAPAPQAAQPGRPAGFTPPPPRGPATNYRQDMNSRSAARPVDSIPAMDRSPQDYDVGNANEEVQRSLDSLPPESMANEPPPEAPAEPAANEMHFE